MSTTQKLGVTSMKKKINIFVYKNEKLENKIKKIKDEKEFYTNLFKMSSQYYKIIYANLIESQ
jgi:hypothetical protein